MQKNQESFERYQNEAKFFDQEVEGMFADEKKLRFSNQLTYEQYFSLFPTYNRVKEYFGSIKDKRILDFACGCGWISIYLARSGARVSGFDISPRSVEYAYKMARANEVEDRCDFKVCGAEDIDYPDNTFDLVFGNAALHHTDLDKSPAEISRVLKPKGRAAFIDDLRYHPIMWLYRKLTTDRHTRFETPMVQSDKQKFDPFFTAVEFETLDFLNLFPKQKAVAAIAEPIDRAILELLPFMKHLYRHLVIKLAK